ncbi:MAG: hypothetical protein WC371_00335 [Parachlamydiales bacterium]|jgi:hypothetical protein
MGYTDALTDVSKTLGAAPAATLPVKTGSSLDTLTSLFDQVIRKKTENFKLLDRKWNSNWKFDDHVLIFGDVFSAGYLAFSTLTAVQPALNAVSSIAIIGGGFGLVAGVINILVGLICFKEASQSLINKNYTQALRLYLDAVFSILIGGVMLLSSIASMAAVAGVNIGVFASFAAFLTANPWILPVLFLIITLPILVEVVARTAKITLGRDQGAKLKLDELKELFEKTDLTAATIFRSEFFKYFNIQADSVLTEEALSAKMEDLQAKIGVRAALKAFETVHIILANQKQFLQDPFCKQAITQKIELLQSEIKRWNIIQFIRLAQQLFFLAACPVSLAATLLPNVSHLVNAAENLALFMANFIPFFLDLLTPFERNTLKVVAKIECDPVKKLSAHIPANVPAGRQGPRRRLTEQDWRDGRSPSPELAASRL